MAWDPQVYARFADERGRAFHELIARIGASSPRRVVDLGCGSGALTAVLAQRWPDAVVEGIDSSPEMLAASPPGLALSVGDARDWAMLADTDVVVSNATLQWIPEHPDLLRTWAQELPAGGWLAWQVPGNFDAPSHAIMRALAESPRWRPRLAGVLRHSDAVAAPAEYASLLLDAGLAADVWETTYIHLLTGTNPVLEWVRGTGLRPVLDALSDQEVTEFCTEYANALAAAYPPREDGTVLFGFRRIFAVGHKPLPA
jgi:trans-aconitate 2-methyltransferase